MSVNVNRIQLLLSHYHSILLLSGDARRRVEEWGLSVDGEIRRSRNIAGYLRKLYSSGRKVV